MIVISMQIYKPKAPQDQVAIPAPQALLAVPVFSPGIAEEGYTASL